MHIFLLLIELIIQLAEHNLFYYFKYNKLAVQKYGLKGGMPMEVKVKCPLCGKRVLDASKDCKGEIEVKCRHCNKIVTIKLVKVKNK